MKLRQPTQGRCDQCRWYGHLAMACHALPVTVEGRLPTDYCEKFEPDEGRVCDTCEWWESGGRGVKDHEDLMQGFCPIDALDHCSGDTCAAWRWNGVPRQIPTEVLDVHS